jgi:aminopeptidase N
MELSAVTDGQGKALPFLQWEKLRNDPDFDQTVLVSLQDVERSTGSEMSLVFESSGVLFEPWGSSFYLVDEDAWAPKLPLSGDDMQHELDLTFPADLDGIGIGERVLEEKKGILKRVVYRTTHPVSISTMYLGDYNRSETQADGMVIELYQRRSHLGRNAKYTLTEVANAIKVFNRMYVPLEFKHLRVTDTPTAHGRGFEGLLLLGGGGTSDADSYTDAFRAHEVAHQWWFNFVRPLDAGGRDRWLSEGFAEYSSLDYYMARFEDPERSLMLIREEWFDPLTLGTMERESLTGKKEDLVGRTSYPLAAGTQNVYTKGPMVLHMLRYLMQAQKGNDDSWYPMLREFLQTWKYKRASTEDFRVIAEKHAGVKLDWFFQQWHEDGGVPVVYWEQELAEQDGAWVLTLRARQEQKKYKLLVPVHLRFPGDKQIVRPWFIDGETGTKTFKLPAKPSSVSLNDRLEALVILKALNR